MKSLTTTLIAMLITGFSSCASADKMIRFVMTPVEHITGEARTNSAKSNSANLSSSCVLSNDQKTTWCLPTAQNLSTNNSYAQSRKKQQKFTTF